MNIISLFYDYIDSAGNNIIKAWVDQQNPRIKAKLHTKLSALEQMSRTDWKMPMTEVLTGDKDGLIAVRAQYQGIQYRLLGYDGPVRGEFTLLAYCTERDDKYIPLDIGKLASERKKEVEANHTRRIRHDFG